MVSAAHYWRSPPPATPATQDLLQTFQPNWAQGVLLLVVLQTCCVQHDVSIYLSCSLARKSCGRLRLAKGLVFLSLVENKSRLRRHQSIYPDDKRAKTRVTLKRLCLTMCSKQEKKRERKKTATTAPSTKKRPAFCYEGAH